ncbi:MAG: helix-turn-helix domain-containing protein [Sphingobacteriales bacterium]|nr:MAG: helix-turn-helix domain-containing protein [Sphingobacteriales bacterium]
MVKENLPVYGIDDFGNALINEKHFYINALSSHLTAHSFVTKPHRHDFYILVYISQGSGNHTIDFVSYDVQPGAWFFLIPGEVHNWFFSADIEGEILFFDAQFQQSYFTNKKPVDYVVYSKNIKYLNLQENEQQSFLRKIIQELKAEYNQYYPGETDIIKDYLDILLMRLGRCISQEKQSFQKDSGQWQIQALQELIEQYSTQEQSPAFYAEKLHLSVKYLNELCKKHLDKTTSQLIQERIILEAKRLLAHADYTAGQVADQLSFQDYSYFARFFKKMVGQTPVAFKKSVR